MDGQIGALNDLVTNEPLGSAGNNTKLGVDCINARTRIQKRRRLQGRDASEYGETSEMRHSETFFDLEPLPRAQDRLREADEHTCRGARPTFLSGISEQHLFKKGASS